LFDEVETEINTPKNKIVRIFFHNFKCFNHLYFSKILTLFVKFFDESISLKYELKIIIKDRNYLQFVVESIN